MSNPIQVVLEFERLINTRNPEAICALMTPEGQFIDSLGNRIQGMEKLRAAWAGYFKMVPDYSISHSEIFADGTSVAIFGSAQGTFSKDGQLRKENFWKTPAAWRAIVKKGKIALAGLCRQRTDPRDHEEIFGGVSSRTPRKEIRIHQSFAAFLSGTI